MLAKEDIKPISYLKTHTANVVSQVNDTHRPLYVTQNGEPKAVLLDTESYEKIITGLNLLKLISQGEKDIEDKRYLEQNKFFNEFEKKHFNK
jgi:prevent-host-death family protein